MQSIWQKPRRRTVVISAVTIVLCVALVTVSIVPIDIPKTWIQTDGTPFEIAWWEDTDDTIAVASSGGVDLIDIYTGKQVPLIQSSSVTIAEWSHDQSCVAFCRGSSLVEAWNVSDEDAVEQIDSAQMGGTVCSLAWNPMHLQLALGLSNGTVCIWDLELGLIVLNMHSHIMRISSLSWSPDGRFLASGSYEGRICVYDSTTGEAFPNSGFHSSCVSTLLWLGDSQTLISGGVDRRARIWEMHQDDSALQRIASHEMEYHVRCSDYCPDSGRIVLGLTNGDLVVWDSEYETEIVFNGDNPLCLSLSADGDKIAASHSIGEIWIWSVSEPKQIHILHHLASDILFLVAVTAPLFFLAWVFYKHTKPKPPDAETVRIERQKSAAAHEAQKAEANQG